MFIDSAYPHVSVRPSPLTLTTPPSHTKIQQKIENMSMYIYALYVCYLFHPTIPLKGWPSVTGTIVFKLGHPIDKCQLSIVIIFLLLLLFVQMIVSCTKYVICYVDEINDF